MDSGWDVLLRISGNLLRSVGLCLGSYGTYKMKLFSTIVNGLKLYVLNLPLHLVAHLTIFRRSDEKNMRLNKHSSTVLNVLQS